MLSNLDINLCTFVSRDYAFSMCLHSYLCSCNSYLSKFLCTFLSGQCRCIQTVLLFFVPVLLPAGTNDKFLFSLATAQPLMSKPDLVVARIEINITTTLCNFTYHSGDSTSCNSSTLHHRSCSYYLSKKKSIPIYLQNESFSVKALL